MKLRPYQIDFCNEIAKSLIKNKSIIAQSPTGSGKTVMLAYLIDRYLRKFTGSSVFICVHRVELVAQTAEKLLAIGLKSYPIIAGIKNVPRGQGIYICMAETLNNRIDILGFAPDLLIVDESHIGSHFKIIDRYKDNALILGFSATPVSNKKKPLKNYFNEIITGPSVKKLIDDGFLAPPQTFTRSGNIDKKALKVQAGDYSDASQYAQLGNPKQLLNTYGAYLALAPGKKTVIFNCNIEHNNKVTELFINHDIPCRSVDGNTDAVTRAEIFEWFRSTDGAVLANVGIATTGFDEPTVECIILNFVTKSLAKYIQCIGRGSRPYPGKKCFKIIDLGENYQDFGLWEHLQDWYSLFHYPEKPGTGAAPTKMCSNDDCGNIVHLSVTICPSCGHLMPRENTYDQRIDTFSCIARYKGPAVDMAKDIAKVSALGFNEYYPLMKMLESSVVEARKITDKMTPQLEKKIKEQSYIACEMFYQSVGKRFGSGHKGYINKIILKHINLKFL